MSLSCKDMTEYPAPSAAPLCVLIVTDGKMGDIAPCRGVAQALGAEAHELVVKPTVVSALLRRGPLNAEVSASLDRLDQTPDVILASGRRAAPYLKPLKAHFGGSPLTVCFKDPRTGASTADLIWVPEHDRLRADNVIVTATSPHAHTQEAAAKAGKALKARLGERPRPWLGVLIGGPNKHVAFGEPDIAKLAAAIGDLSAQAGTTLITPSRRTPAPLVDALRNLPGSVWLWDGEGNNPYAGMLGTCDAFLVTGDSHNMVSEVLSAGRQTMVFRPHGLQTKFTQFLDGLAKDGLISEPTTLDAKDTQERIDSTPVIADAIRQRLAR